MKNEKKTNLDLYPFLIPLLSWTVGILVYQFTEMFKERLAFIAMGLAVSLIILLLFQYFYSLKSKIKYGRLAIIFMGFFFFSLLINYFSDVWHQKSWFGNHLEQTQSLMLKVEEEPIRKKKILTIPTQVLGVYSSGAWKKKKGKLDIHIYLNDSMRDYQPGDYLLIPNELVPILNSGNPFTFQQAEYARLHEKYYQAFLPEKLVALFVDDKQSQTVLFNTKNKILDVIYQNVADSTTASLMSAIMVNERSQMDKDLWMEYSRTGIAHIVAISGMHITLFFTALAFLLYWIRSKRYEWLKYLLILPMIWLYISITGFPPSAVRAGIMFTFVCIAMFVRRSNTIINTLFATAFFILLFQPLWLFDVGFQLSFLSVLSILIFYKPISKLWQPENKILNATWQIISVSLSVQILLTPVVVYYFNQISVWTIVANLPAGIYSSVFMSLSLILVALGSLGLNMSWLGDVVAKMTEVFHYFIHGLSGYSPEYFHRLFLNKTEFWICMLAIIFWSLLLMTQKKRYFVPASLMSIFFFISLTYRTLEWKSQHHIIVYNAQNKSLITEIKGRGSKLFTEDGIDENDRKYILKNSEIAYGLNLEEVYQSNIYLFQKKQQKILCLNRDFSCSGQHSFPVDVLVISGSVSFRPDIWMETFRPQKIVLDGSIKRYQAKKWKAQLTEMGIDVHWVAEDGAWIL